MRKQLIFYHFVLTFLGCIICSCSTTDVVPVAAKHNYMDPSTYSAMMSIPEGEREIVMACRNAAMIIGEHVSLANYKYTLDISKEEANKLGISDTVYARIAEDIDRVNKFVSESMANGDTIVMPDSKKHFSRYKNPEINYKADPFRSRRSASRAGMSKASGRISTDSPNPGEASFKAVDGITDVFFYCLPKGAYVASYVCTVTVFGTTKKVSGVGFMGCNKLITVPVVATGKNMDAKITFQTSDPNGGWCSWNAC